MSNTIIFELVTTSIMSRYELTEFCTRHAVGVAGDDIKLHILVSHNICHLTHNDTILSSYLDFNRHPAMVSLLDSMIKSSNGNIFRVTDPLWGQSTTDRWIPLTKASAAELWYFLWSAPGHDFYVMQLELIDSIKYSEVSTYGITEQFMSHDCFLAYLTF